MAKIFFKLHFYTSNAPEPAKRLRGCCWIVFFSLRYILAEVRAGNRAQGKKVHKVVDRSEALMYNRQIMEQTEQNPLTRNTVLNEPGDFRRGNARTASVWPHESPGSFSLFLRGQKVERGLT